MSPWVLGAGERARSAVKLAIESTVDLILIASFVSVTDTFSRAHSPRLAFFDTF